MTSLQSDAFANYRLPTRHVHVVDHHVSDNYIQLNQYRLIEEIGQVCLFLLILLLLLMQKKKKIKKNFFSIYNLIFICQFYCKKILQLKQIIICLKRLHNKQKFYLNVYNDRWVWQKKKKKMIVEE